MDSVAENAAARRRILTLVSGLTDDQLLRPVGRDWTVGAELAHLAFWDRVHVGRLRQALAEALPVPPSLPEGLPDLINTAELAAWRHVPGRDAAHLFETTSREIDEYLATLDPAVVHGVRMAGMPRLVERFRHRNEHADAIERAL